MAKKRKRRAAAHPYEMRYWAKKLKTTPALLSEAIDAVGSSASRFAANIGVGKKKRKKRKAKKRNTKKRKAKR